MPVHQLKQTTNDPPATHLPDRAEILTGSTYKIKPGTSDHAIYITINSYEGKPYEVFLNCKCPDSYSWLLTTTRLLSAIFRTGQDPKFIIDELKGVIDPKGGYFYPKQGYIPSVQAHIGLILEKHLYGR